MIIKPEKEHHLPPVEFQKHNIKTDGLIETPLDERGLVDLDRLIDVVKLTVDSIYKWSSSRSDIHHLQWYSALYDNEENSTVDSKAFRDLMSRKTIIPRTFHNWLHYVTEPPPVPDQEVMQYSIDAERVAISLARTSMRAVRLSRNKTLDSGMVSYRLEQALDHYNKCLEKAKNVPSEFSLITLDKIQASSVDEMLENNKLIGRLALSRIAIRDKEVKKAS